MADLPENILAASKEAVMQLLPKKSYARYINAYDKFVKWQQLQNTESFYQEVMLAYFLELSKTLKPSTLWSIYSMIKSTISCNHNVNFGNYDRLAAFLSSQKSGFTSKKSNVFTAEEIKTFLMEAPDNEYLAVKVVLIFGICGACRGDEIVSLTFNNVKDDGEQIVFRIPDSKTNISKFYPINGIMAEIVRKYIALRPQRIMTDRFFVRYWKGRCTLQVIGKNVIAQMPRKITVCLGLPNPETYTGHAFRRSSTTMLADSLADIEMLKRHGGWKSDAVARGYVQESLEHKRQIAQKLVDAMALQPIDQNVCDGGSTAIEKKEHVVITQTLTTQTISSHLIQKSQYI